MEKELHLKYLAASAKDLLWGLAVNSVGFQEVRPGEKYPPSNHPSRYLFNRERGRILDEYQLLYIIKGKGTFRSASHPHPISLEKGSIFLLFPQEWHSYAPDPGTGWKEYWIGFGGRQMETWMEKGFFSKNQPVWNIGLQNDIVELYMEAISAANQQKSGFQQHLGGIVAHLLSLALFHVRNKNFSDSAEKINQAKIIIADSYRCIHPEEVARQICMGYNNFRKIFKDYTGFSPAKYIQFIKLNKVKEALTNTNLPVHRIAYDAGYENEDYFFTIFRRNTGMTPLEYRKLTQGKIYI